MVLRVAQFSSVNSTPPRGLGGSSCGSPSSSSHDGNGSSGGKGSSSAATARGRSGLFPAREPGAPGGARMGLGGGAGKPNFGSVEVGMVPAQNDASVDTSAGLGWVQSPPSNALTASLSGSTVMVMW